MFLCVTFRAISTLPTEKSGRQNSDLISDHRADRIRSVSDPIPLRPRGYESGMNSNLSIVLTSSTPKVSL